MLSNRYPEKKWRQLTLLYLWRFWLSAFFCFFLPAAIDGSHFGWPLAGKSRVLFALATRQTHRKLLCPKSLLKLRRSCEGAVWQRGYDYVEWNSLNREAKRIGNERTTVNQSGIQQKFRSKDLYLPLSYSPWPSAFSNWSFLRFYFWSNDSFSIDRISGYLTVALCAHLSWKFPFDYCLHCVLHLKDQHWANAQ